MSWEDVISAGGAPAKEAAVTASAAALPAPISWMDVIGGADSTVGPNAVAESRNEKPASPVQLPPVQQPVQQPLQQQPPMMSPPWDPAPAVEQLAKAADQEVKAPLNWADVIGVEAGKKDGET